MAQPDMPTQPVHTPPHVIYVPPPSTNGLATAAMVCGIAAIPLMFACFLGFIPGVAAIIMGHVAYATSKKMSGIGKSKAIAGLGLGYGSLVVGIIFLIIYGTALGATIANMPTQ